MLGPDDSNCQEDEKVVDNGHFVVDRCIVRFANFGFLGDNCQPVW